MTVPWAPGSSHEELSVDTVDIWRIDLSDPDLSSLKDSLSDDECIRADRFAFAADQDNFIRSRAALRHTLSRYLDCDPANIEFCYNEHGRPELAQPDGDGIDFNLSHSSQVALIALARDSRVGVDVDRIGRTEKWAAVAKRSFSLSEQSALLALPKPIQEKAFYQIWTQKEAYTKAIGDGFSYGFSKFSVMVSEQGNTGLIADEKNPLSIGNWCIKLIEINDGLMAAVAYDGAKERILRYWEFPGM